MTKSDLVSNGLRLVRNHYVMTALAALIWVTFVADIDLLHILREQRALNQLEEEVSHYEREISAVRADLLELSTDQFALERYARESYFMKRPDEDLYRIVSPNPTDGLE